MEREADVWWWRGVQAGNMGIEVTHEKNSICPTDMGKKLGEERIHYIICRLGRPGARREHIGINHK